MVAGNSWLARINDLICANKIEHVTCELSDDRLVISDNRVGGMVVVCQTISVNEAICTLAVTDKQSFDGKAQSKKAILIKELFSLCNTHKFIPIEISGELNRFQYAIATRFRLHNDDNDLIRIIGFNLTTLAKFYIKAWDEFLEWSLQI